MTAVLTLLPAILCMGMIICWCFTIYYAILILAHLHKDATHSAGNSREMMETWGAAREKKEAIISLDVVTCLWFAPRAICKPLVG